MAVVYHKEEPLSYPIYTSEEMTGNQRGIGITLKKQNPGGKVPYGRKRSCWKKKHSSDDNITPQKSVGEAGVITCAICGIQRFYKFMKQTKKFGLHSCEPCRKFISSNILSVKNGEHLLYSCAKKGAENCLLNESIPVNDGAPRSKKDALSNMRCKSCWLSLCLEKYQMPIALRNSLAQFIVEDDRPAFTTSDVDMSFEDVDFRQLTKRRTANSTEEKSCLKVLSDNFLKNSGLDETLRDKKKVVILRIKC